MAIRKIPAKKEAESSRTNRVCFNLGPGSYEWPERMVERAIGPGLTPARVSVAYGRMLTLAAVDKVEPRVLRELSEEPRRVLQESGWDWQRDDPLIYRVLVTDPRLRKLRASLRAWSKRWHLTDQWCLELALSTLRFNSNTARLRWRDQKIILIGMAPPFRPSFDPPLGLRPFDPTQEWRRDYRYYARVYLNPEYKAISDELAERVDSVSRSSSPLEQDQLLDRAHELGERLPPRPRKLAPAKEQLITKYLERVETTARAEGLLPVPELPQPQVFSWLAAHQIYGWTPRLIAEASCVYKAKAPNPTTVVEGIKKLSDHIGLTPRRDRPPSPRGKNRDNLIRYVRDALEGKTTKIQIKAPRLTLTPERKLAQARAVLETLHLAGLTDILTKSGNLETVVPSSSLRLADLSRYLQ